MEIAAIILVLLLAFANGANDVSKSAATLVGGQLTHYSQALRWGSLWTTVGALLGGVFASGLAARFANALGPEGHEQAAIPIAVLIGAMLWVGFSSRLGLPVSTTHAITGAILGVGWVAQGLSPWARHDVLAGFFIPLLASPFMALALLRLLSPLLRKLQSHLDQRCVCVVPSEPSPASPAGGTAMAASATSLVLDRKENCKGLSLWSWNLSLDSAHWASSALLSLCRGMNDAPKIWALCFPLLALGGMQGTNYFLLVALVAGAMGAGSLLAGRKVSVVLAERVTRMNPAQSLGANLTAALLVGAATAFALPVSTTHVSSGAIIGVGLEGPKKNLRWRVVGEMVSAWVVTLPLTAAVAAGCYLLLR